jgi:hypothetical protein
MFDILAEIRFEDMLKRIADRLELLEQELDVCYDRIRDLEIKVFGESEYNE